MNIILKQPKIRKAIAVYVLKPWLDKGGPRAKTNFAKDLTSLSRLGQLYGTTDSTIERNPTEDEIDAIADRLQRTKDSLIMEAIMAEDKYHLLGNLEKPIREFKKRNNRGEFRTHDPSDPHIENLNTFCANDYKIYFLRRNKVCFFDIAQVPSPIESGYIELIMPWKENDITNVYTGTLIAPPLLGWAFIFIEYKVGQYYRDRGVIAFNFPRDMEGEKFIAGAGVMLSVDRDQDNNLLFQRVLIARSEDQISEEWIKYSLARPIELKDLMVLSDIEGKHNEVYRRAVNQAKSSNDQKNEMPSQKDSGQDE